MKENKEYWKQFYKKDFVSEESSFARFVLSYIKGDLVDLGCGNYRDTNYFLWNKIDAVGIDQAQSDKDEVGEYIKNNKSPRNVYARFFWHCISRELQLEILKWAKDYIFIEARTIKDQDRPKAYGGHERNYVDPQQLLQDLRENDFRLIMFVEGIGFSKFKGEDPHLLRVIARRKRKQ